MKDYICLTKNLLRTFFRQSKQSGKSRLASFVAMAICGAIITVAIAVSVANIGQQFKELGVLPELTTILFGVGFAFVLIFGTIGIFTYVYFAKDNEFLFTLPIKTSTVYLSKLTVVYFQEFLVSTLIMLPGLIALGISTAQPFLFYVMILLAITLVPVCPLFISSFIAIPMMAIASFFKNKGAASAILLILLFAIGMGVYMYFVTSLQNAEDLGNMSVDESIAAMQGMIKNMTKVLYPLLCLARFGTLTPGLVENVAASAFIDLAIFLGTVAIGATITILISGAVYKKSVLKQGEHAVSTSLSAREYVQGSALEALVKKEWRELIRNTSFAFQCLSGIIIAPVFSVFMMFSLSSQSLDPEMNFVFTWFLSLMMTQTMSASLNQSAITAITREGKSFAYSKSMPVPYTVQLLAKIILSNIISIASVVLSIVAMTITSAIRLGYVDVIAVVFSLIFLIIYCMAYINISVITDLKNPRLDWVTPREAIKGNVTILVPTLIGLVVSVVSGLVLFAIIFIFIWFFDLMLVGMLIGFTALIILYAIALVFSGTYIKNNANRYYEKLTI